MADMKPLPRNDVEAVLALARRCREAGEPDAAESMCLDALEIAPDNQDVLMLLLLARIDLLDRGFPRGVERAREVLPRLAGEYEKAFYAGLICDRQARVVLSQRGNRSGHISWEWFQFALDHYTEAARVDPQNLEPALRANSCTRLIARNRHCVPGPSDREEHGIE